MEAVKYFIKIGDRYLSWVDENWYETNKKGPSLVDTISNVKECVANLAKHYVYNPSVFEVKNYDFENAKQVTLFEPIKKDPYLDKIEKPIKVKCVLKF